MKTKNIFLSTLLLLAVCCNFIACSKDDDKSKGNDEPEYIENEIDQLAYLQHNLVVIDEDGNFQYRSLGVSLNPSDTTVVSVGVANLAKAKEMFASLFSSQTEVSSDGMRYTLADGGTAWLVAETGEGKVAVAYFDVPQLKHVSKVVFIENSAWPANAENPNDYKLGEFYEEEGFCFKNPTVDFAINNAVVKYLCVREAADGNPALLIGFSDRPYMTKVSSRTATWDKHLLKMEDVVVVYSIIKNNHDALQTSFESIGNQALSSDSYWIGCSGVLTVDNDDYYYDAYEVRRSINISAGTFSWKFLFNELYYIFCKKIS